MTDPAPVKKPIPRLVVDKPRVQVQPKIVQPQAQPKATTANRAPSAQPTRAAQTDAISTFIGLEIEARQCADLESLRFAVVNSTRKLAGFDEAFLAEAAPCGGWIVSLAAGVHKIDRHAPLVQFMDTWLSKTVAAAGGNVAEPKQFELNSDAQRYGLLNGAEVAFPYALWIPIKSRTGAVAALIALKSEPWRPQTVSLLIPLAGAYGHAWDALTAQGTSHASKLFGFVSRTRVALSAGVLALIAGFIPVPMSALAPAEVVAREPVLVTAPLDGVIAEVLQPPGAMVQKSTPLVLFSDVNLRNSFELAKRNKAVAQAKYFKSVQTATSQQKEVEEVAIAKAELDVASGDLAYAEEMLGRTAIKAERAGLLIYSAKSDWIGRPVKTGERIMEIGNPEETELRIEVPVSDAITLQEGGDVALFLDGDPLTAVHAKVARANYRPSPNAENQLVYRVTASFADGVARRIGLRGVARVSSHKVPLAFYLFRRPIAALRQRFGV